MTTNLLDWDEDLQTSPDEEYQALLNGLRRSQGFGLYFVQCSPFSGGKLIERVQADLTERTVGVLEFEQPIVDGNVFKRVSDFLNASPVNVLFIQGLENSLFDAEETKKRLGWSTEKANAYTWREVPPVLINLNQQRERFRDSFAACFVFLLPQYAIKYLIHRSPDFFDWRSGLVNYASDADTLAQESKRIIEDSDYDAYCNWSEEERTSRLFAIQTIADEAETTLETLARLCFEQGLLFAAARDFSAATICFDKAAKLKPDYHEALYNKGVALYDLGDKAGAIACYDAVLAIKPDFHDALYNKGNALYDLGNKAGAIACYDAALAIKPDFHDALYNKGNALSALGREEGALAKLSEGIACYAAALEIKPDKHEALDGKGYSLATVGRIEEAINCFNKAIEISPRYANAIYNKAFALSHANDLDKALELLEQAFAIDPKYRDLAKTDTDFDSIRTDERFQELVEGE